MSFLNIQQFDGIPAHVPELRCSKQPVTAARDSRMGSAATTAKQPLAEVDIKNEIGVLYGKEAQQAFAAAKEDDVVAWPKVQAYAEAHGLLDPKVCSRI